MRSLWVEPAHEAAPVEWPALEFRDVFKIYRSGPVETVALRGLDLRVERGEMVAVLGPSGCGKSTFLSLAAGLDTPSAGEVRAFGRTLSRLSEPEIARYRAEEIALVFQCNNLLSTLSARANVGLALQLAGRESKRAHVDGALATFGVGDRASHRPDALSGGEQQRAAIAAAAARRAALVLADEPTGELDERNERIVLDALTRLRDEARSTVVVVTHSEAVAGAVDRVIEMRDGTAVS